LKSSFIFFKILEAKKKILNKKSRFAEFYIVLLELKYIALIKETLSRKKFSRRKLKDKLYFKPLSLLKKTFDFFIENSIFRSYSNFKVFMPLETSRVFLYKNSP